ncbi:hypothetical protein NDU88_004184, partial [Pleurodeles waltl]
EARGLAPQPYTSHRRPSSSSPAHTSPTRQSATTTTTDRTRSRSSYSLSARMGLARPRG